MPPSQAVGDTHSHRARLQRHWPQLMRQRVHHHHQHYQPVVRCITHLAQVLEQTCLIEAKFDAALVFGFVAVFAVPATAKDVDAEVITGVGRVEVVVVARDRAYDFTDNAGDNGGLDNRLGERLGECFAKSASSSALVRSHTADDLRFFETRGDLRSTAFASVVCVKRRINLLCLL
jgi:hypothetical protein